MPTFMELTRKHMNRLPEVMEIAAGDILTIDFSRPNQGPAIRCRPFGHCTESTKALLRLLVSKSHIMNVEVFLQTKVYGLGPKIFRPTIEQCRALANMTLNISLDDFETPFPAIVIELPEGFAAEMGLPRANVSQLYFDKENRFFIHNVLYDTEVVKSWWRPDGGEDIENWFKEDSIEAAKRESDLPTAESEVHGEERIRRVALNYCLLLDEVGVKKVGPASPNEYAALVKYVGKQNKHTAANKMRLQSQGIIYQMAKETTLVRTESGETETSGEGNGKRMSSHWRRGHYRMQVCGVGRAERKRIRIPPVIVNKGDLLPPAKEYRT